MNNHLRTNVNTTSNPDQASIADLEGARRFYTRQLARHTRIAAMRPLRRAAPTLISSAALVAAVLGASTFIPSGVAITIAAPFALILAVRGVILGIESPSAPAAAAHSAHVMLASANTAIAVLNPAGHYEDKAAA